MSGIATAIVGSSVVSGYLGKESAEDAAAAQERSGEAGIKEQRRQFDAVVELLKPYVQAGAGFEELDEEGNVIGFTPGALQAQQALIGLAGADEQQAAIDALKASPQYTSLVQTGEEAILQNASATGGLRGGNVQNALARYRPEVLAQLIESQYGKLGDITQLGQASAAGQASAGQTTGANIGNLLTQIGQAQAGSALAQGQAYSDVANSVGQVAMLKGLGVF